MKFEYCARRSGEVVVAPHKVGSKIKSLEVGRTKTQERDRYFLWQILKILLIWQYFFEIRFVFKRKCDII